MAGIQEQDWHHKGSHCCTPLEICCLVWWCPCIAYGRTHHRIKNDNNMQGYSCCNLSCVGFTALAFCGLSCILPMIQRGDMRAKYHLKGNGCKDCLCACCCQPCDMLQQEKESEHQEMERQRLISHQPGKENPMQYGIQQPQPAYH
ncbi:hypothetical protein CC78DRAFT_530976 [Lojkania enalia]|uniref:PLAC8-domain-containing protein n=1 Tax=Lojkania enalia TaxID=147567 RepID=A0A9P4KEF1_9PLEO|nr:hypothetical protein CC78DRAFT_530976 [Didymosphaeria enalia]